MIRRSACNLGRYHSNRAVELHEQSRKLAPTEWGLTAIWRCNSVSARMSGLGQGRLCRPDDRRVRSYPNSGSARTKPATPALGQLLPFGSPFLRVTIRGVKFGRRLTKINGVRQRRKYASILLLAAIAAFTAMVFRPADANAIISSRGVYRVGCAGTHGAVVVRPPYWRGPYYHGVRPLFGRTMASRRARASKRKIACNEGPAQSQAPVNPSPKEHRHEAKDVTIHVKHRIARYPVHSCAHICTAAVRRPGCRRACHLPQSSMVARRPRMVLSFLAGFGGSLL